MVRDRMSSRIRKSLPHAVPFWIPEHEKFFLTICCERRGHNQLCTSSASALILDSAKFYQDHGNWYCHLFLLMPDHLHAIVSFPRDVSIARFVRKFKIYTAKTSGIRWQRDFFDHRLRNDRDVDLKWDYILENPVRAGLVKTAEEWPFSWAAIRER